MILGTAVLISTTTLVGGVGADSASVSITDPDGTAVATDEAMSDDGDGDFSFIYQSTAGEDPGTYKADVDAVAGINHGVERIRFEMED